MRGADAGRLFEREAHPRPCPRRRAGADRARGGRFAPEPGYADHPVTEATWYGAQAFCAWRGARLPSEAEWEAAVRGREGRTYFWGESPPRAERAWFGHPSGETAAVDTHPAGATPEGVHDLAGTLAAWTSSLYEPYPYHPEDGREDPEAAGERVTRGGCVRCRARKAPDVLSQRLFTRTPERPSPHRLPLRQVGFSRLVRDAWHREDMHSPVRPRRRHARQTPPKTNQRSTHVHPHVHPRAGSTNIR